VKSRCVCRQRVTGGYDSTASSSHLNDYAYIKLEMLLLTSHHRLCGADSAEALHPTASDHGFVNTQTRTPNRTNTMTAQRSAFGSSTCSLPRIIAFILPGRRTLSEHLPTEMINVPIALAQRSKYLRKVIAKYALANSTERQIRLPNIDSIGFRMYVDWLEGGEFRTASTLAKGSLLLRDSFDYIFAHIAGSQLEDPDFQDCIIDALEWLLNASKLLISRCWKLRS
jgi:hypothetical protein